MAVTLVTHGVGIHDAFSDIQVEVMCTGLAKLAVRNVQVVQWRNNLLIRRPDINTIMTGIDAQKIPVFRY